MCKWRPETEVLRESVSPGRLGSNPISLPPGRLLAHNGAMRAGLYLSGWALLALTALSLVGEMAARGLYDARGFYLSAEELWAVLAPESFAEFRAWFRSAARPFWTYGIGPVLKLPAWLLFGIPGMFAIGYARRFDPPPRDVNTEAIFLYEELAKRAQEEDPSDADDRFPEDSYTAAEASARAAEADWSRDPIGSSTPETEADKPPPVNRPPS